VAITIEIDQSNGGTETVTDGITSVNAGSSDTAMQNTATNPITAGQNSYELWLRWHVTSLGGATAVDTFKAWAQSPPANHTFAFNGHTVQATYNGANHKQTVYAAPAATTTRTPETLPTAEPASANIGIGGSLTGQLTAAGRSDYYLLQVRPDSGATVGSTVTASFGYQVVA